MHEWLQRSPGSSQELIDATSDLVLFLDEDQHSNLSCKVLKYALVVDTMLHTQLRRGMDFDLRLYEGRLNETLAPELPSSKILTRSGFHTGLLVR